MNSKQLLVAAAIVGIMGATAAPVFAKGDPKGQCTGVNGCKGKGACKSTSNDCKGKNECKGKGWMSMTEKKCTKKGGTWTAMPAPEKKG